MPIKTADGVDTAAKLFRGLADRNRLGILLALAGGESRVTDLVDELGCSQSNVSGHLACLRDCGLVESRADGRQTYYRLARSDVAALLRAAETVLAAQGHRIDLCRRYES
jgi:DNA-binding transcriptional ArsR family regulator